MGWLSSVLFSKRARLVIRCEIHSRAELCPFSNWCQSKQTGSHGDADYAITVKVGPALTAVTLAYLSKSSSDTPRLHIHESDVCFLFSRSVSLTWNGAWLNARPGGFRTKGGSHSKRLATFGCFVSRAKFKGVLASTILHSFVGSAPQSKRGFNTSSLP